MPIRRSSRGHARRKRSLAKFTNPATFGRMRDQHCRPLDGVPGLDAWVPWHPDEVPRHLAGIPAPWCVAGGWAIDLWLGKQTRTHHDLEIAVLRPDFAAFRARLNHLRCFVAADGELFALPAHLSPQPRHHQIWLLDQAENVWRMGLLLEPGDVRTWIFRRDETIHRPRSQMIAATAARIPYLKPEGILLYKAKATRPKDEMDFTACAPLLDFPARSWLKNALVRSYPSHPWIDRLG
jgi:hypothetical protein